ncbi:MULTISPECIES: UDP-N-acetylmuramoyl-tripeptide--D-alanyl-D-alanine ligase [unclassified Moraxella]|uniref:UDP-N-acetylmuramoyl-tripeptide--D-alanyl-D- alanine ligase n=1 Tax=unclassified Moraxella TaxID=2685852 RepID=UPI003AF547DF
MTPYIWQTENLTQAVQTLNPTWHGKFTTTATRIITDTRKIEQGDIFLAIKGDNFDGHDYVQTAYDKGALMAIVSHQTACQFPQLIVDDTKLALGQLGKYRRDQHPNLKVVAITGSMGKTTAKEMLGSILSGIAPTLVTRGNLNNDLGVPMMLLELCDEHQFAVMELGANHVGEIAYTTQLVSPDVACVLNIGTAHLGEFGGRDNIAKTKAEIFQGLQQDDMQQAGVAVVPFGDDYFDSLIAQAQQFTPNVLTFGERDVSLAEAGVDMEQAKEIGLTDEDTVLLMGDVFADDVDVFADHSAFSLNVNLEVDEIDSLDVCLNFSGEHNIVNALASTACAVALGVPLETIATGLENAKPAKGRLNFINFTNQTASHTLIDDTYNSNPSAVLAGADVLIQQDGYKVLVLGDIGELGDEAVSEHAKLGENLAKLPVDNLLVVGDLMAHTAQSANVERTDFAIHFANKDNLTAHLQSLLAEQKCSVLVKGSRFMAMETVLQQVMG